LTPINLDGGSGNLSFNLPTDVILKNLSVSITTTDTADFGEEEFKIYAQIYVAADNSNQFFPVNQSLIELTPVLTGVVTSGTIIRGSVDNIDVPIPRHYKVLFVVYPTTTSEGELGIHGVVNGGLTLQLN
jgi:hypothetical protein